MPINSYYKPKLLQKLGVDCTGEGVMFIEADPDVRIEEFGEDIFPPFPCLEELIFPISVGVFDCPLLLIQVTRMKCGGFIFAISKNHTTCDAFGIVQFLKAVAEMARGESSPSVPPTWRTELLNARDPPHVTSTHRAYDEVLDTSDTIIPLDEMIHHSFFFTPMRFPPSEVPYLPTLAASPLPLKSLPLISGAATLLLPSQTPKEKPESSSLLMPVGSSNHHPSLGYALQLVMRAKDDITGEHMRSLADFLVIKGRPTFRLEILTLSDLIGVGFGDVDFGWGNPAYGGPVGCVLGASFYVPYTNAKGEFGVVLPICLPGQTMKRFEEELKFCQRSSISFIKPAL